MFSFRRNPATAEGPRAQVDLRTLAGLHGALLFAQGLGGQQMVSTPCQVVQVDRTQIRVELTESGARPGAGSAVILEVLHQSALIQCFTSVDRVERGGVMLLRVPARPHVVQRRRYPRIDLYVGVTFRTPSRPIEESVAQMTNLSQDGAALVLAEPLAPGTPVSVNLSGLQVTPPWAPALVVRCSPTPGHLWVVGIRFEGLAPEQSEALTRVVAAAAPAQAEVSP